MIYTFVAVACVFSGVAMLAALHTLVSFNRVESSFRDWSQSLAEDCNKALDARYQIILDAVKKDVLAEFDRLSGDDFPSSGDDVQQYIEENDIEIGSELKK